jgi:hypothetical protein
MNRGFTISNLFADSERIKTAKEETSRAEAIASARLSFRPAMSIQQNTKPNMENFYDQMLTARPPPISA